MARMMYCQKCNRPQQVGALFCDDCGTSLLPDRSSPVAIYRGKSEVAAPPADMTPATPPRTLPRSTAVGKRPMESHKPSEVAMPRIRLRLSSGKTFELAGKPRYVIGRRDPQQQVLPEVDLEDWNGAAMGVSRQHAAIHVTPDGVFIEDLESLNETIVNNCRLLPHQRYPLTDGEQLRLGSVMLWVVMS